MGQIIAWAALALLAAMGTLAVGWLIFGRLVAPVGTGIWAVLPAAGGGDDLEHRLSSLLWLSGAGLARFRVIILDRGLDQDGLRLVSRLKERWPEAVLCKTDTLSWAIDEEFPSCAAGQKPV